MVIDLTCQLLQSQDLGEFQVGLTQSQTLVQQLEEVLIKNIYE